MESDRLSGWKEISAYLRKGVRTAQRWEKEYGLPIHRIGEAGGEIVFAFRSEIVAWEARQSRPLAGDPEPPSSDSESRRPSNGKRGISRLRTWAIIAPAMIIVLAASLWAARAWRSAVAKDPVRWVVKGRTLTAFNADQAVVWTYQFDFPLMEKAYEPSAESSSTPGAEPIQTLDLDGDGTRETVVMAVTPNRTNEGLYCFNSGGTLRFRFAPTRDVQFGAETYRSPWAPARVFPGHNADGSSSLWVTFIHSLWFPTMLVELDSAGKVRHEYWSNGYISLVEELRFAGKDRIFVGAANNEKRGASLAVFDRDRVRGSAPAENPAYRCSDCPTGQPTEFFIFPGTCIVRPRNGTADVWQIKVEQGEWVHLLVTQGAWDMPGSAAPWHPGIWYDFDRSFGLGSVNVTSELVNVHEYLRKTGLIDHEYAPDPIHSGLPVLRWNGVTFVPTPRTQARVDAY